jgi:hypothetical protein
VETLERIGAGWLATCLLGGLAGLIAATAAPAAEWWRVPLLVLSVAVIGIGILGLVADLVRAIGIRRKRRQATVDAPGVRALAEEGHTRLEANNDLKANAPDAESRSTALRLWMERWDRRIETALEGDPEALACFRRVPNTAGMHWIEVPVQQLRVKLECLQPYVGGSFTADAVIAASPTGMGEAHPPTVEDSDALHAQITRGSSNPGANEVNWTTRGQRNRHIHLDSEPRALRFFEPVDTTVTSPPVTLQIGSGQLIVTRFFTAGFMVDEVGTSGDVVRAEPYRD